MATDEAGASGSQPRTSFEFMSGARIITGVHIAREMYVYIYLSFH